MQKIKSFEDVVNINSFVFESVPWTIIPYTGNDHKVFNKNIEVISFFFEKFKSREMGGWCGLNCEYFKRIVLEKQTPCLSFNYGIQGSLTHITVRVILGERWYLFDPYFNKYYEVGGKPIDFFNMIQMVNSNKMEEIKSVYGGQKKPIQNHDGSWSYMTGQELEKSVLDGFRSKGLDNEIEARFGNANIFNLMKIEIPV